MASTAEDRLLVLLEKLKETDDSLAVCIVLLQQYLRGERNKIQWSKSIGIQVNVESRSAQTVTDHKAEEEKVEKSITAICEKLKSELTALHTNIEKQNVIFQEDKDHAKASTSTFRRF
ncbi:uncharacterized protein LOC123309960 [Coccinella septempunctata]|uniref:uncharacterized protein LOC123309960 n=1 Tax=Coccinella septempunctata TaxID=41139 RepID=UPI001D062D74|nr:uncharacterized protein LOC123309960 [Coccinella septempunctata]